MLGRNTALKPFGLESNKDVALVTYGAQPEVFAAVQHGVVQAAPPSYSLDPKVTKLDMRAQANLSR